VKDNDPSSPKYPTWNGFVEEATEGMETYLQPLPPPEGDLPEGYEPEVVEVPCPDGDTMEALTDAQRRGDDNAAFVLIFGEDNAVRLLTATASLPFTVRARLLAGVMNHYGLQAANLGE
jgi:hypothetical protein